MTGLRFAQHREYDIVSDGVTVWVNGAMGLLGRFGRNGIDIHRPLAAQAEHGECLFCTNTPTTAVDWDVFVSKMQELHGVKVHGKYIPTRFKKAAPP